MNVNRTIRVVAILLMIATTSARAGEQEPLTCALLPDVALDLGESAAFQLLTVELSKQDDLALLERAEIERLLESRSYEAAFAAEGGGDRRNLGTLLRVDLLVVMRARRGGAEANGADSLDVVIAETSTGLRLSEQTHAWDDLKPEALVERVAADVARAAAQIREPVAMVLTVPPFISDDLTGQFDAMQAACALFIRQTAASAPGVRVVALEEVRAVAEEFKLSAGDSVSRNLAPYFVTGHYRNNVTSGTRSVDLSIEVTQSGVAVSESSGANLLPEKVPDVLRTLTEDWLKTLADREPSPSDPAVEKAQLLRRAADFQRLNDWKEALDLYETALLIDPADTLVRGLALEACAQVADRSFHPNLSFAEYKEQARRGAGMCMRGLDHLELSLRAGEPDVMAARTRLGRDAGSLIDIVWACGDAVLKDQMAPRAVRELGPVVAERKRAILFSHLDAKQAAGRISTGYYRRLRDLLFHPMTQVGRTVEERFADQLRLLRFALRPRVLDGGRSRAAVFMEMVEKGRADSDAYRDYVDQVSRLDLWGSLAAKRARLGLHTPSTLTDSAQAHFLFAEQVESMVDDINQSDIDHDAAQWLIEIFDRERSAAFGGGTYRAGWELPARIPMVPYLGWERYRDGLNSFYAANEKAGLARARARLDEARSLDQSSDANQQKLRMAESMYHSISSKYNRQAVTRMVEEEVKPKGPNAKPATMVSKVNPDHYLERLVFLKDAIALIEQGDVDVSRTPNLLSRLKEKYRRLDELIVSTATQLDVWHVQKKERELYLLFFDRLEESVKFGQYDVSKRRHLPGALTAKRTELKDLMAKESSGHGPTVVRLREIRSARQELHMLSQRVAEASRPRPVRPPLPKGARRTPPPTPTPRPAPVNLDKQRIASAPPKPTSTPKPTPKPIPTPRPTPLPPPPPEPTREQADILNQRWSVRYERVLDLPAPLQRWIPCSTGVDLICGKRDLFIMKEKGQARSLLKLPENDAFTDLIYDGRHAWAPLKNRVLRVDPVSEKIDEVTESDGLPPGRMLMAAVSPGRLVVVGYFGRTWIANLIWTDSDRPSVDVFHEARYNTGPGEETHLLFMPRVVWTAHRQEGARVLVARGLGGNAGEWPLIVDPKARSVEVLRTPVTTYITYDNTQIANGDLCWLTPVSKGTRLWRFDRETLRVEEENTFAFGGSTHNIHAGGVRLNWVQGSGCLFFLDGCPFFINWNDHWNRNCFLLDTEGDRLVSLIGNFTPGFGADSPQIVYSSHYGPMVTRVNGPGARCFRIALTPTVAEMTDALKADAPSRLEFFPAPQGPSNTIRIRVYRDPVNQPDKYVTANIPSGNMSVFRPSDANVQPPALLVMVGADQVNAGIRKSFLERVLIWELRTGYPTHSPLSLGNFWAGPNMRKYQKRRFSDVEDTPLSGAQADVFLLSEFCNAPVRIPIMRRHLWTRGTRQGVANVLADQDVRISDHKYGIMEILNLKTSSETMLRMARKESELWRGAARGVVVDADGQPIREARVRVRSVTNPAGNPVKLGWTKFVPITDANGEFQYIVPPKVGGAPTSSAYKIIVEAPVNLELQPFEGDIFGGQHTRVELSATSSTATAVILEHRTDE